ncbi:Bug family tripartite tricarboxylate transporter substrate binding protein [Humitalea rosea]|nr:tripartite tricarboxylate transporter substrate-binding protein [Humitalea rosea]
MIAGLAVVASLGCGTAMAQDYPNRPIRLVVPYPAGGTTDIIARALQEPLRLSLGQPIIIENRGGGAGATGQREVLQSPADGYSLLISNNGPTTILPLIRANIGYEATGALAPISLLTSTPLVLVTNIAVPVTNLREFFDYVRARPDRVNYGTAGVGSFGHVATLLMAQMAGLQAVHVPYRGQAPMTLAVLSGEVQFTLTSYSQAMNEHIEAGKLRRLGVSSAEPSSLVPNTPPIASVLPGYSAEVWFGLLAPAHTPAEIVAKLNDAVRDALAMPAVQAPLRGAGMQPAASTPEAFAARLNADAELWRGVLARADIKPE